MDVLQILIRSFVPLWNIILVLLFLNFIQQKKDNILIRFDEV